MKKLRDINVYIYTKIKKKGIYRQPCEENKKKCIEKTWSQSARVASFGIGILFNLNFHIYFFLYFFSLVEKGIKIRNLLKKICNTPVIYIFLIKKNVSGQNRTQSVRYA